MLEKVFAGTAEETTLANSWKSVFKNSTSDVKVQIHGDGTSLSTFLPDYETKGKGYNLAIHTANKGNVADFYEDMHWVRGIADSIKDTVAVRVEIYCLELGECPKKVILNLDGLTANEKKELLTAEVDGVLSILSVVAK